MRFQGKIDRWNDTKGFGFVTPNGGGEKAFVHISNFEEKTTRPKNGDLITYEQTKDEKARIRAEKIQFVAIRSVKHHKKTPSALTMTVTVSLLAFLGIAGISKYKSVSSPHEIEVSPTVSNHASPLQEMEHSPTLSNPVHTTLTSKFKCDGRTTCSTMSSCEEASFFTKNCPNTTMDGDGDGIPCEDQWCQN